MDTESQNIEFKQLWRDEYLKWICGFANAQGGTFGVSESDLMRSANLSTRYLSQGLYGCGDSDESLQ